MNRSKYWAKKVILDWINFDSEIEARFYSENKEEIYKVHPRYILQPSYRGPSGKIVKAITYIADFEMMNGDVIDVKGKATEVANIKRKIFWYMFPNMKLKWLWYVQKHGGRIDYGELESIRRHAKKAKKLSML